ncbi:MAG: tRNA (cytidine(34)-2'-O)-methyltransferase [Spirochaetales bacterium]|nr:tRNA (cytidine(34)-2'-O)-methyltransferase [Spirochaetales bacterium]
MKLHIVLHEPEIPQNTGNIARTCAAIGARLHLIEPLGFSISEKAVRRAGLDYWDSLDLTTHPSIDAFLHGIDVRSIFPVSTKAPRCFTEVEYPEETYLLFGKESKGLPEQLLQRFPLQTVRIPMAHNQRSLNLSNAAAVTAYEVLRQHRFADLETTGCPVSFSWESFL